VRIQLLSEGGGIGDILQRLGIAQAIKAVMPEAELWFFVQDMLAGWVQLTRAVDKIATISARARRGLHTVPDPLTHPYLNTGGPFDAIIDLYDPADSYEVYSAGPITIGRQLIYRRVANAVLGVNLPPMLAKLVISKQDLLVARTKLVSLLGKPLSFIVGLQPLAHWAWRSLSFTQVKDIVMRLTRAGAQCVFFHHTADPIVSWAKEVGAVAVINEPAGALAAMVSLCDLIVSADSGFFHIAGTLGVPAVGVFAQTDGDATSAEYPSCKGITAGPTEREGLLCRFPCYRRTAYGCNWPVCEKGCRALRRVNAKYIVATALKLLRIRRGTHLAQADRMRRLFRGSYSCETT